MSFCLSQEKKSISNLIFFFFFLGNSLVALQVVLNVFNQDAYSMVLKKD